MHFRLHAIRTVAFTAAFICSALTAQAAPFTWSASPLQPLAPAFEAKPVYTSIAIDANDSIQTDYISTFPTGTFTPKKGAHVPYSIPATPATCGYTGQGPCDVNDTFCQYCQGATITLNVSIPNVTKVYAPMNGIGPPAGVQLATIEFVGSRGTTQTFPLVGGENIRDYYNGTWANTLNNGVPGVKAHNVFTCVDPTSCLGGGGSGNVNTGFAGTYRIDEQVFSLAHIFAKQALVQIILTDTASAGGTAIFGMTAASKP
jgi:hypothetical protein